VAVRLSHLRDSYDNANLSSSELLALVGAVVFRNDIIIAVEKAKFVVVYVSDESVQANETTGGRDCAGRACSSGGGQRVPARSDDGGVFQTTAVRHPSCRGCTSVGPPPALLPPVERRGSGENNSGWNGFVDDNNNSNNNTVAGGDTAGGVSAVRTENAWRRWRWTVAQLRGAGARLARTGRPAFAPNEGRIFVH